MLLSLPLMSNSKRTPGSLALGNFFKENKINGSEGVKRETTKYLTIISLYMESHRSGI